MGGVEFLNALLEPGAGEKRLRPARGRTRPESGSTGGGPFARRRNRVKCTRLSVQLAMDDTEGAHLFGGVVAGADQGGAFDPFETDFQAVAF
jgi:hypothetical protein